MKVLFAVLIACYAAVLGVVHADTPEFTGHGPGELRGVNVGPKIQPEDVATLVSWHVNLVRWQLTLEGWPDPPKSIDDFVSYDKWLDSSLEHLDQMLPYFKKAGILVLIDLHSPPGGNDSSRVNRVFTDPESQKHFLDSWNTIAVRYKGESGVWGYDLLNEPGAPAIANDMLDWHDLAEKTARNIRSVDATHAIIVEPDPYGSPKSFRMFKPIDVPGVVYSVHMYDPAPFIFQGVMSQDPIGPVYPGEIGGKLWNKEHLTDEFQPVVDFAKANNVDIYVGEFSAIRWAKGADQWLSDVVDIMESNHWDWSYHAYREWSGWSLEASDDPSVRAKSETPTARQLVMEAAFDKNRAETTAPIKSH